MRSSLLTGLILLNVIFFISCRKIEQLPPIPKIEFISFAVFDSTDILGNYCKAGKLKFYFQDGDGDLGAKESGLGQDTMNLFFTLFRQSGGVMVEVPDDDLMKPSAYRIPYMVRLGQNKILKGKIDITFLYLFYDTTDTDTIMYEFKIKDRANHFSNTESTCDIPLSDNGLYIKQQ